MHRTRKVAFVARLLVVLVAAATVSACDVVVTSLNARGKAQDQWTRTYPISAGGKVEILNTNGAIDVVGSDGTQVEVMAERTARAATDEDAKEFLKQVVISEEVSAGSIRLETKVPRNISGKSAEVAYHLKVPASVGVRVENTNGQVTLTALKGDLRAETTNGGVRGQQLSGAVAATTTNGSVKLQFDAVAAGGIQAETTNGSVDLTIPSTAKADVKARCVNGGIGINGLTLEGGESSRRRVDGRLNGGGPTISAETTNGAIRITGK
jgi:hypothetical protein